MNTITSTSTLWSKKIKSLIFAYFIACMSSIAQVGFQADLNHDNTVNVSDVSYLISLIMGRATDASVSAGICPNALHPHFIDLGLPSGTKWTCCNIGAANPLEYGDYYAWGDYFKNSKSGSSPNVYDIAQTRYDVAYVNWGSNYSMPTHYQWLELIQNCSYQWTTINGVNGGIFTGSNGNNIFLPAAGSWNKPHSEWVLSNFGEEGFYWSSNQWTLTPNSNYKKELYYVYSCLGTEPNMDWVDNTAYNFSVRPVESIVGTGICPDDMHPHVIDLGLPSGTKWTCCNIGATNPLEYGDYYAWGEILTKDSYTWSNYSPTYGSLGDDIAKTEYDVAYVKWGSEYSMPTHNQFLELIQNCSYHFITINGVCGGIFTGSNGYSIFLPSAGLRDNETEPDFYFDPDDNGRRGYFGFYWASTKVIDDICPYALESYYYPNGYNSMGVDGALAQSCGFSVRPVVE